MKQAVNPCLPNYEYVPDVEPHVFGDRVYLYGSHDVFDGQDFCLNDYVCWSASVHDLAEWKYEGVIYRKNQDPRNENGKMHMCAPDCVRGVDGRYYLYYQLHELACTSVAVSDTPVGPFEFYGYVQHQDGTPWGEKKGDSFVFDPGAFVDEDGKVYLYVGHSPAPGFYKTILKLRGNRVEESVCLNLDSDMKTVIGGEQPIVPGPLLAKGTEFDGHGFFEASSMRKINGKYYYVYSSVLSHELCYAISDYPNKDFHYGGTLVSIGDIGFEGNQHAKNSLGNTHGGMECINGNWYIFYHRQTNKQKCCRQCCAEQLQILPDGAIPQVEVTSCGMNNGPLLGNGTYDAAIACTLTATEGVLVYEATRVKDKKNLYPYFTQTGVDREDNPNQYIANMRDGATAGFRYFALQGKTDVSVKVKGEGKGTMEIRFASNGNVVATIPMSGSKEYTEYHALEPIEAEGTYALYFTYKGSASVDFMSFNLNRKK